MSAPDDKDALKDRKTDDKTIVQLTGARETVWPDASDPEPVDVSEEDATTVLAEPENSEQTPEFAASEDDIWAHTTESLTSEPTATEVLAEASFPSEAPVLEPSPAPKPLSDTPETSSADSEPPFGADASLTAQEEPEPSTTPPEDHAELTRSDEQPGDLRASEEDEDATPPEAPRIEVPVQQQYASLLAALSARIEQHPGGHDLLAVLRMLEGQTAPGGAASGMDPKKADEPAPPRIGKSRRMMEDIVRFGQDPSSEFAPSTIERATRNADGGLVLLERFLGLLGPQGGLPATYTDEAIMRGLRGDDSFPRFLDVFNNRFVQLFFRAWADARPIVQHDRPDDDRFLAYLGSSIGIGAPLYRDLDRIDDRLKLLYAGVAAPKTKSAIRLKALITGVFGVQVEIDQCVGTWLHLDQDDQLQLGGFGPGGAGQLGADTIVGAKVYSVSDKIRIRIFTRSLEEYRKFLPPTRTKPNPWTEKLFDLIDFYLGLEIEYEIELALPKRCASSVKMDGNNSATLGHIGWLKPADHEEPDDILDDEEMLTDTRFRPVRRHTTVYQ